MNEPKRILLVDDHVLFRSGIHALLKRHPGFNVVAEASDGLEGYKQAVQLKPDVVLLDLNMPGMSGIEALKMIKETLPGICVIMLTVSEGAEDLLAAIRAGANGYLLKNIDMETFTSSLNSAISGEAVISPQLTSKLVIGIQNDDRSAAAAAERESLSPREREVLGMLGAGVSNKVIAGSLSVAENTVKVHIQHILRKLNLETRIQAAIYAAEHGYAKPHD